jgi:hypothetical protein
MFIATRASCSSRRDKWDCRSETIHSRKRKMKNIDGTEHLPNVQPQDDPEVCLNLGKENGFPACSRRRMTT